MSVVARLKLRARMVDMTLFEYGGGLGIRDNLHGEVANFFWNTANQGRKVFRKCDVLVLANNIIEAYSRGRTPFPSKEAK